MKEWQRITLILMGVLVAYPLSYLVLMDPNSRAYEPATGRWFPSSFRLSRGTKIPGDLSIYGPKAGTLNYFYLPLDRLRGKEIK
jgi:hypothetical protein